MEIRISNLDTVYGNGFEEITLNEFFSKLEKNIKSDDYSVLFDDKTNRFIITYGGINYTLLLDKETMNNYILGKYNSVTLMLNKLSKSQNKINAKEKELKDTKDYIDKIINDAENKHLLPDDNAKRIYLDYLKKNKKFSFTKIKNYFSNFYKDVIFSIEKTDDLLKYKIWPFADKYGENFLPLWSKCFFVGLCQVLLYCVILFAINPLQEVKNLLLIFSVFAAPFLIYGIPVVTFLGLNIKNRFKRLIKNVKSNKLLNHKIKKLANDLMYSKTNEVKSEDITFEINKQNQNMYSYENNIYMEINKLINRTIYINVKDRSIILKRIKDVFDEYNLRKNKMEKKVESGLFELDSDNEIKLNMEIISKIGAIESEINSLIEKESENKLRNKEKTEVEKAMKAATYSASLDEYSDDIDFGKDNGTAFKRIRRP